MNLSDSLRLLHPATAPSPELAARIETMARIADAKPAAPRLRRLPVLAFAGLVAASIATFALIVAPKRSLARTMETVYQNVQKARGVHFTVSLAPSTLFPNTLAPKSDAPPFEFETWRLGGSWRTDSRMGDDTLTQIVCKGLFWNVYPAEKRAAYQKAGSIPPPSLDTEALRKSVTEALLKSVTEALRDPHAADLGMVHEHGKRLRLVGVTAPVQRNFLSAPVPGRSVYVIDDEKLLPVRVEQQLRERGLWRTVSTLRYDFAVSPRDFEIPAGYEKYSVVEFGKRVGKQFARPIAQKRFATRTIALRDVQANRDGDLFILYTDGSSPVKGGHDTYANVVSDNRGTRYTGTAGGMEPFMFCENTASNRGLVVDGQAMQGNCVVPVTPPLGAWKPRTVTVEIQFIEYVHTKAFTRTASFTVPVGKPRTAILPTYGRDLSKLSLAGGNVAQFKRDRAWARRSRLYGQDWRGLVVATDREIAGGIADINTYLDRAGAFGKLGKPDAARAALTQAEARDTYGFYAAQIAEVRKALPQVR